MRDGWREVPLGEIVDINPETVQGLADRLIRYIDLSSVSAGRGVDPSALAEVPLSEAPGRARRLVRHGDVLVATVRPYLRGFGVVPPALDGQIASTAFAVLRARTALTLPGFVWLLVRTDAFVDGLMARATGSNYPAVRPADVAAQPVPLPPLAEQRRIVDLIAAVDGATSGSRRLREAVVGAQSAVFDRFVEGIEAGLVVSLGSIAEVVSGVTKDEKRQQSDRLIEVPYLRVANVQRGYLDLAEMTTIRVEPARAEKLRLRAGDILFNEGGDRDKLGRGWVWEDQVADCIHQNHVLRARLSTADFDPWFVSIWGNSGFGRRWFELNGSQTTNLASLNLSTLRDFPIPAVLLAEQRRVVDLWIAFDSISKRARDVELVTSALRATLVADLLLGDHEIPSSYDRFLAGVA